MDTISCQHRSHIWRGKSEHPAVLKRDIPSRSLQVPNCSCLSGKGPGSCLGLVLRLGQQVNANWHQQVPRGLRLKTEWPPDSGCLHVPSSQHHIAHVPKSTHIYRPKKATHPCGSLNFNRVQLRF